ncbi:class I SAM-dependent methyltransferase [Actinomadura chibensis]|uniref:Class I SAM-dependent methyltransferase n=1 Tax=Actinomadura chibensis TaxID=392828 RepID=A0A5D0NM87_9ACTN|nr:class I SAM-dependent methyltransferase [Actinomadura chibensis]
MGLPDLQQRRPRQQRLHTPELPVAAQHRRRDTARDRGLQRRLPLLPGVDVHTARDETRPRLRRQAGRADPGTGTARGRLQGQTNETDVQHAGSAAQGHRLNRRVGNGEPVEDTAQAIAIQTQERWEANADYWVKVIRERRDRYRTELTDAAVLDAIGPCEGLRVLDAGCGEGYLSRTLTGLGADVDGVDACQSLIDAASAHPSPEGKARFAHATVDDLPFADGTFDLVVCNHLFSHLPDPTDALREIGRVLKSGGRLVLLTLHPCFYVEHSERGSAQSVPAAQYFSSRGIDQRFLVDGLESPAEVTSWLRPLEFYAGTLRDTGFVIADLREPHPSEGMMRDDPWWRKGFPTAMFMLLIAERR